MQCRAYQFAALLGLGMEDLQWSCFVPVLSVYGRAVMFFVSTRALLAKPEPPIQPITGLVDEQPYHALVMQYYRRGTLTKYMSTSAYEDLTQVSRLRLAMQVRLTSVICKVHAT
jgi:hypothetical protein